MSDILMPPDLQLTSAEMQNSSEMRLQEEWGKQLYENLNSYFLIWYLPLILVIGTFGAIFCMLFIFMSKMFPKIIQIWLVSICFGDFMILMWDAMRMFTKLAFEIDFRDQNTVICKLQAYLSSFFFHWSAYNQAAMSIQRLIFISAPLKSRSLLTKKRVVISWACLTILLLFPNATYLLHWHIGRRNDCEPTDKWFYYITTLVHLIVWGIIPLASMTISTCSISYMLLRYRSTGFKSGNDKQDQKQVDIGNTDQVQPPKIIGGRRHGTDPGAHVTRLLVSMNLFYLFTTFPLLIYMMHLNFRLENRVGETIAHSLHKFYYYLFRSLCFLNASLNWVFYCAAGKIFRQKAKHILQDIFCRTQPQVSHRRQRSPATAATAAAASTTAAAAAAIDSDAEAGTPMLPRSDKQLHSNNNRPEIIEEQ